MLKSIIIGTVVALVSLIATKIFTDKAELKYTLTQAVANKVSDDLKREFVQELLVKNVGKDEAKNIKIKLNRKIIRYDIRPNAASDKFSEILNSENGVEIVYDILQPLGEIKLSVTTIVGLVGHDIDIIHAKGKASEAFSNNGFMSFVYNSSIALIYTVLFFSFMLYQGYYWSKETDAKYESEQFLSANKPMLLTDKKIVEMRKIASESLMRSRYLYKLDDIVISFPYRHLNGKSNVKLDASEVDSFEMNCSKAVIGFFVKIARGVYDLKELSKLFDIEKPVKMQADDWDIIHNYLSTRYIELYLDKLFLEDRFEVRGEQLERPKFINDKVWLRIKELVESIVVSNIATRILERQYSLPQKPEECFSADVSKNKKDKLNNLFYAVKLIMIQLPVTNKMAEEMLASIDNDYKFLNETHRKLITEYCNDLIELEQGKKKVAVDMGEVAKAKAEIEPARLRVVRQLQIIDAILNIDHDILDKIEDYEMPFAAGNAANLRKIGLLLRDSKIEQC